MRWTHRLFLVWLQFSLVFRYGRWYSSDDRASYRVPAQYGALAVAICRVIQCLPVEAQSYGLRWILRGMASGRFAE
jgi:hypothetical protein